MKDADVMRRRGRHRQRPVTRERSTVRAYSIIVRLVKHLAASDTHLRFYTPDDWTVAFPNISLGPAPAFPEAQPLCFPAGSRDTLLASPY